MNKKRIKYLFVIISLFLLSFSFLYFKFIYTPNNYNLNNSGNLETKGNFIPEQSTDYIFTTVKTEFSITETLFIASLGLLILFLLLKFLLRKSKNKF